MKTLLKHLEDRPPTVLLVGDVMCDHYVFGRINRISPEAPVPVFEKTEEFRRLGGAANVAANLRALGCAVRLVSVVGADSGACHVRSLLHEQGIADMWLIEDATRPTTEKTRLVAHQQQVLRVDQESRRPVSDLLAAQLLSHVRSLMKDVDGVVCSDYEKGVCTADVLGPLFALANTLGRPIVVDPKKQNFAQYRGATVLTPNVTEVERATGLGTDTRESLENAVAILLQQSGAKALLVTRGKDGVSLFSPGPSLHIPSEARDVFDVTGAGDTVIATFSASIMCGFSLAEASRLANVAAGIVVGKIGTAVVSLDELRTTVNDAKSTHSKQNQDGAACASYMAVANRSERWRV
jgi:D-beta-D-heptose 7-phosphate kinase / D-beta-D-heptose 1-phosphate adenosyltransferase